MSDTDSSEPHISIGPDCVGSGQCEMFAPDVFVVGHNSRACVREDVEWTPERRADLDEAVQSCPTESISVDR